MANSAASPSESVVEVLPPTPPAATEEPLTVKPVEPLPSLSAQFRERRQVSFHNIEIHEHPVILGDNPGGSRGPPLSIDWEAQRSIGMLVEEYEKRRPERRNKYQFTLPEMVRIDMLKQSGYSRQEIAMYTAQVNRSREQRQASQRAAKLDGVLEMMEKVHRGLANWMTLGRRKRQERLFLQRSLQFDKDDLEKEGNLRSSIRTARTDGYESL